MVYWTIKYIKMITLLIKIKNFECYEFGNVLFHLDLQ